MPVEDSAKLYIDALEEKLADLKSALEKLVFQLGRSRPGETKPAIEAALDAVDHLCGVLSSSNTPGWLRQLDSHIRILYTNSDTANAGGTFLKNYLPLYTAIDSHSWKKFLKEGEGAFDFDAAYEEIRTRNKIPELFDRLANDLQSILDSDLIDSLRAIETLESMIAVLRQNRNGSSAAVFGVREYINAVTKKWAYKEIIKIPLLGTLVESAIETFNELSESTKQSEQEFVSQIASSLQTDAPILEEPKLLTLMLNSPEDNQPPRIADAGEPQRGEQN